MICNFGVMDVEEGEETGMVVEGGNCELTVNDVGQGRVGNWSVSLLACTLYFIHLVTI